MVGLDRTARRVALVGRFAGWCRRVAASIVRHPFGVFIGAGVTSFVLYFITGSGALAGYYLGALALAFTIIHAVGVDHADGVRNRLDLGNSRCSGAGCGAGHSGLNGDDGAGLGPAMTWQQVEDALRASFDRLQVALDRSSAVGG